MTIKSWWPLIILIVLASIPVSYMTAEYSKPHDRAQPAKPQIWETQSGKSIAVIGSKGNHVEGNQEADWRSYFDKPTDWILAVFTGLLVIYTRRLYQETAGLFVETRGLREAANSQKEDMAKTIAVSGNAANAALKSAKVAKSALKDIERALVYCKLPIIEMPTDPPFTAESPFLVMFELINSGKTWTKNGIAHMSWGITREPINDQFTFPNYGVIPGEIFIPPASTVTLGPLFIPHRHIKEAMEGRAYLYVWGWCEYDDIFEDTPRHRTEICYFLRPIQRHSDRDDGMHRALMAFTNHHRHNGADDDCMKPIETTSLKNPLPAK